MTIKELEAIMIEHSVVLRAIPLKTTSICETENIDQHPDGQIKYLERFKRDMLLVDEVPALAGRFIVETQGNISCITKFGNKAYYPTIEAAVDGILHRNEVAAK